MKITKETIAKGITATIAGAAMITTSPLQACSPDPYIGSVCITAASFCPANSHIEANGQLLDISSYTTLYSLLGTTYGGNGTTNFAVPDMRGRTPVGAGSGPGLSIVPLGLRRGIDYLTLAIQNMPTHSHAAQYTPGSGTDAASVQASTSPATKPQVAEGDYIASNSALGGDPKFISAAESGTTVALGGVSGDTGSVQVGDSGGSQPFPNYPPQQALKYCIAVNGTYPSRP